MKARAQGFCPVCRQQVPRAPNQPGQERAVAGHPIGSRQRRGDGATPRAVSQAMTNILWLDRERHLIPIRRSVAAPGAR